MKFTEYQRYMWQVMTYFTLSRYYIDRDFKTGNFVIKKVGCIRIFFYYLFWTNAIVKVTYLVLAYRRYLPVEVHFLDQMGMCDWLLCFSQLVQETNMWHRQFPMQEILKSQWKIQEQVFLKLGSPKHVEKSILKDARNFIYMHTVIVASGCLAILIQFQIAPKYAANLYAVIPWDSWYLRILFCLHEMSYVYHIWIFEAWSIIVCELYASSYTRIVREMTSVLEKLIELGVTEEVIDEHSISGESEKDSRKAKAFMEKFIWKRRLNPKTKVPSTDYDIMSLLHDYEKLTIATNFYNSWVGRLSGGIMCSNYSQFISDVFMIFQLLKEPETDFLAIFFYAHDATSGMIILIRMLIITSRLYPASEEFLRMLRKYLVFDTPLKKYLIKFQNGLRIMSTNLGGYKTKAITVPKGINALMNWYVNAAMWQRPKDRRT